MRILLMALCLLVGSCFAGIVTDNVSMPDGDTNVMKELKVGTTPISRMTPGFIQSRQLDYDFPVYYRFQVDRVRTNSMSSLIRPFTLGFGSIMEDNNPSVVMSCGATSTALYGAFVAVRWGAPANAPTAPPSGAYIMSLSSRVFDGVTLRQSAQIWSKLDGAAASNAVATQLGFSTAGATGNSTERYRIQSDGSLKIFNMTTAAGSVSGGGLLYATNGEIWVKDASGNATQISPHNETGERVLDSYNVYSGVRETVNITKLAQAIELLLPAESPLKGQIYSRVAIESGANWEADQQKFKAERDAEIETWVKAPYEEREQLGPMPLPYSVKPAPAFVEDARRK